MLCFGVHSVHLQHEPHFWILSIGSAYIIVTSVWRSKRRVMAMHTTMCTTYLALVLMGTSQSAACYVKFASRNVQFIVHVQPAGPSIFVLQRVHKGFDSPLSGADAAANVACASTVSKA